MNHTLQATTRTQTGKSLAKFRRQGKIPANIFRKHAQSTQIWVDSKQLSKVMQTVGEGSLLYIQLDDQKQTHPTIIRDVDSDIRNIQPNHVSFQEVSLKEAVTVEIELEFIGEAKAIKAGLVIETPVSVIEISALPTELPESIQVDLTNLESLDDRIIASDVVLPKGVSLVSDPDSVLVAVVEPMSAEPEEAAEVSESEAVAAVEATEAKSDTE